MVLLREVLHVSLLGSGSHGRSWTCGWITPALCLRMASPGVSVSLYSRLLVRTLVTMGQGPTLLQSASSQLIPFEGSLFADKVTF